MSARTTSQPSNWAAMLRRFASKNASPQLLIIIIMGVVPAGTPYYMRMLSIKVSAYPTQDEVALEYHLYYFRIVLL